MTYTLRLGAVLGAILLLAPQAAATGDQICIGMTTLTRTFVPPGAAAARGGDAYEVTREDLEALYTFGTQVRISFSYEGEVYPFDVGRAEDEGRRSWTVPDADYSTTIWISTDPATTPYGSVYPEATHVLVTDTDPDFDGTRYQFYNFGEELLVFEGAVDAPPVGDVIIDPFNSPLTLLPFGDDISYVNEGTFVPDDDKPGDVYPALYEGGWFGLGDLVRPDGSTVEAGAYVDDLSVYAQDG